MKITRLRLGVFGLMPLLAAFIASLLIRSCNEAACQFQAKGQDAEPAAELRGCQSGLGLPGRYSVNVLEGVAININSAQGGLEIKVIGLDLLGLYPDDTTPCLVSAVAYDQGVEYRYPEVAWDGRDAGFASMFIEDELFSEFGSFELQASQGKIRFVVAIIALVHSRNASGV